MTGSAEEHFFGKDNVFKLCQGKKKLSMLKTGIKSFTAYGSKTEFQTINDVLTIEHCSIALLRLESLCKLRAQNT